MSIVPSPIKIRNLVASAIQNVVSAARGKGLTFDVNFSEQLPEELTSDKNKLSQILAMLSDVAVRQCNEGRITLSVGVSTNGPGQVMSFEIGLDGQPSFAEHMTKILDKNSSVAELATLSENSNEVMTLRMISKLCGLIGSQLKYRGVDDGGACYTFCISCDESAISDNMKNDNQTQAETTQADQATPASSKPVVLVVDDVDENRALVEVLLRKMGNQIEQAGNGKIAADLCLERKFDLILMDLQMPVMDGLEATGKIRAEGLNLHTPIIAMTASGQMADDMAALEAGCNDTLGKPLSKKKLERKVFRMLAQNKQIEDAQQGRDIISFLEGDPDYQKAIETFVDSLPGKVDEIKNAYESHDMKDLAFKIHALKGLGGFAGFPVFTEKAKEMEDTIKTNDLDSMRQQLDELIKLCMRTKLKVDTDKKS